MKEHWKETSELVDVILCGAAQRERIQFEGYTIELDDDTLLGSLISHGNEIEGSYEIYRMIDSCINKTNF